MILAVSVDPAMLNVWTGFLTLAGLPRRIIWERRSRTRHATFLPAALRQSLSRWPRLDGWACSAQAS